MENGENIHVDSGSQLVKGSNIFLNISTPKESADAALILHVSPVLQRSNLTFVVWSLIVCEWGVLFYCIWEGDIQNSL